MTVESEPLFLELPLRRACVYAEDSGLGWIELLPVFLSRWPQLTPADYWELTVAEHLAMVKALEG